MPNPTGTAATLVDLVRLRAERDGDRVAYHFLVDGEVDGPIASLTYAEVERRARAIAASLQAAGGAGERAVLLYPPGLDFVAGFFGALFAGVIAVPVHPPDLAHPGRSLARLTAIARDAGARFVLTVAAFRDMAGSLAALAPELASLRWIATDALDDGAAWRAPDLDAADTALLQYTSGSTGAPRGVVVSHHNLLVNSAAIHRLARHDPASVYVCWVPSYHDMGLIGGILQPIYGGLLGVLLSPAAFLQRPARWLRAITRFRGTTSPFPNFALDLCVRKILPVEREGLDLRSWRLACNGAEPVRAESLARFSEAFGPYGFAPEAHYPAYGLAEATLIVTGGQLGRRPVTLHVDAGALRRDQVRLTDPAGHGKALVGCGEPLPGHELAIVDPRTSARLGEAQIGEVWLRGPSVTGGYWNLPDETRATFGAELSPPSAGEAATFLRTGDLGFVHGGQLFVTGRLKDLVIVRGRNHYPQDLERTVERAHPAVRPGGVAAFGLDGDGEEGVGVALEVDARRGGGDVAAVVAVVRAAVAREHELALAAVALLAPGALPKTSSGKLQRRACRDAYLRGNLGALHVWQAAREEPGALPDRATLVALDAAQRAALLEEHLVARLAGALGVEREAVDPLAPVEQLGVDSLTGVSLHGDLERGVGVSLPLASLLRGTSSLRVIAASLARQLDPPDAAPGAEALDGAQVTEMLVALLESEG